MNGEPSLESLIVEILKVEAPNPDDIQDAFKMAETRLGRIDVVYNSRDRSQLEHQSKLFPTFYGYH